MPRPIATLTLTALALTLLTPLTAAADPEVKVDASAREVRQMGDPVLIDRRALETRIAVLAGDIETLDRMLELVRDRRERQTFKDQLSTIRTHLDDLRGELREGASTRVERDRDRRRGHRARPEAPPPVVEAPPAPATGAEMTRLSNSLREATFRKDKMRVMRLATPNMFFSTAQARQIVEHFSFNSDKVEVLAMLYPQLVDPENAHTLFAALTHASDRRKLEEKINALNGQPAPQ